MNVWTTQHDPSYTAKYENVIISRCRFVIGQLFTSSVWVRGADRYTLCSPASTHENNIPKVMMSSVTSSSAARYAGHLGPASCAEHIEWSEWQQGTSCPARSKRKVLYSLIVSLSSVRLLSAFVWTNPLNSQHRVYVVLLTTCHKNVLKIQVREYPIPNQQQTRTLTRRQSVLSPIA